MVAKPSNLKASKPRRWSASFTVQTFVHFSIAFIVTYLVSYSSRESWPGDLLFFPWVELGPLVWPINVAVWLATVVGACVCFFRALNTRPNRWAWVLVFHLCVAGMYLIPIVICLFGTYAGP